MMKREEFGKTNNTICSFCVVLQFLNGLNRKKKQTKMVTKFKEKKVINNYFKYK